MKTPSKATDRRERIEMSSSILFMFTYVLLLLYAGMYGSKIGAEYGKWIPTECIQCDKTQEFFVIFTTEYLTHFRIMK